MFVYPLAWLLHGGAIPLAASSSFLMTDWIVALGFFLASLALILADGARPRFTVCGRLVHRAAARPATVMRLAPRFR